MDPGPPLRDIGCFALVAQRLSFSRAAAELHMSQPAMSQAIGRLERSLGVRLFERTSREVRLSPRARRSCPTPTRCWRPPPRSWPRARGWPGRRDRPFAWPIH
ncbi:LysR family transcriptional regulator [Streptosporangium lutulentum]